MSRLNYVPHTGDWWEDMVLLVNHRLKCKLTITAFTAFIQLLEDSA